MRHLLSALLALVLAPAAYACAGYGAARVADAQTTVSAALGLVPALVAGALYAILVMARLSPVGPVLAGLLLVGVSVWAIADPAGFADRVPADLPDAAGALHRPAGVLTAVLAAPLLGTVFSPRRWRRTADDGAMGYNAAPDYPPQPGSAAPAYGPPPVYEPPVYTPPSSPTSTTLVDLTKQD